MPDETTSIEATEAEAPKATEPQGDETDWKAEARKWEKRAKDSKKDFDRVNKVLEGYEAKAKEDEAKEKTSAEALEVHSCTSPLGAKSLASCHGVRWADGTSKDPIRCDVPRMTASGALGRGCISAPDG